MRARLGALRGRLPPALFQAGLYALGLLIAKGVSFVMLPIVTRWLTTSDYGALELLSAFADAGGVVIGFGLVEALFRFAGGAGPDRNRPAAGILGQAVMLALFALVAGQIGVTIAKPWLSPVLPETALRLVIVSLAFTACLHVPLAWLRLVDRAGTYFVLSAGKAVLQALLVVLFLSQGMGVVGVVAAGALLDVCLAAILVWLQWRETGIRFGIDRALLAYGGPLVLSGLAGCVLGSFDRLLLAPWVSAAEIGLYGLGAKLAFLVYLVMQPFDLWWYPRRFAVLAGPEGKRASVRAIKIGVGIAAGSAVIVSLAAPLLLHFLTPEPYHAAAAYVPWLALAATLSITGNLVNAGCYARKTGMQPFLVNGTAALVTLAGYLTLIPTFGTWGAVAATLLGFLVRLVLFFVLSQRQIDLPLPLWRSGWATPSGPVPA